MTCVRSLVKQKCVLVHLSQFSLQCCGSFLFPSALINLDCPLQIWTWKLNWNPFQNNPFCNVCGESFTWLQNCQYKNFVGFFPSHALFCSYAALNLKPRQAACLLKPRFHQRNLGSLCVQSSHSTAAKLCRQLSERFFGLFASLKRPTIASIVPQS